MRTKKDPLRFGVSYRHALVLKPGFPLTSQKICARFNTVVEWAVFFFPCAHQGTKKTNFNVPYPDRVPGVCLYGCHTTDNATNIARFYEKASAKLKNFQLFSFCVPFCQILCGITVCFDVKTKKI